MKWIKNTDVVDKTYAGYIVSAGAYFFISADQNDQFKKSSELIEDVGSGITLMALDNSGSTDITNIVKGMNYLLDVDPSPRNYDDRQIVHATPRYRGTSTCFTSIDDDQTDPSKVWGGSNRLKFHHQVGQAASQSLYMDFNTIDNLTYILTGFLRWHDTQFDEMTVSIVPQVTSYSAGSNTDYDLYGGYLVIPNGTATGTISINDVDRKLVQVPTNEFGQPAMQGWFDADYNTTTKQFENIVPNATGSGAFNMFTVEITFHRYLNNIVLYGTGHEDLTAFDADQLAHGTRLKFTFDTIGTDHEWEFIGSIVMFRKKSS